MSSTRVAICATFAMCSTAAALHERLLMPGDDDGFGHGGIRLQIEKCLKKSLISALVGPYQGGQGVRGSIWPAGTFKGVQFSCAQNFLNYIFMNGKSVRTGNMS